MPECLKYVANFESLVPRTGSRLDEVYVKGGNEARTALIKYLANFKDHSYVFIDTEEIEAEEKAEHVDAYTAL